MGCEASTLFGQALDLTPTEFGRVMPSGNPAELKLQVLRQGSRGKDVEGLQRLLNTRLAPSPALNVDGFFGPFTHQAVLPYQRGVRLTVDGVVGKQTANQKTPAPCAVNS